MGFLRFLSSLRTLAKNGDITIRDAYKFAQQEFGEVSDLLKLQINKIFKDADAPSIRKPEGEVIEVSFKPGRDKTGKVVEESESQRLGLANLKNPYRAAGPLDPVEGMTRTAARVVLDRKGIKVPERGDPIDVFEENFGGDALMDLRQAGEELLEKEQMGRITESMGEFLESRGLFDLKVDKTLPKGMTDEELLKKLMDEDPEEFAKGGRVGFDDGGILSLEEAKKLNPGMFVDTTTYNPIPENAPNMAADQIAKVIMGTLGMDDDMTSRTFIFEKYVMPKRKELMENFGLTMKEADDLIREGMAKYRTNKATGGRVGFQIGGPAYDATNPIYGSSAITVTPDTIMGPQGNQIQAQIGRPNLQISQNPFKNLGFLNTQKHFDQNQLLKNAVASGEITPEQYNELGGYDVTQTMAAGNPVIGGIGNLLGSTAYNVVQSLKGDQPFSDIPGDVYKNVKGGMGLISDDLKSKYENIINKQPEQPFLGRPVESITTQPNQLPIEGSPSKSNNLLSLFERYKDIQTPTPADPESGFVGETALGNIEKGIKNFLGSNKGLKYGKDIPSDINDIYSFIEAERRSFSPDLSQNYYGGDLYNYLQDFYSYKYGNPGIDNFGFSGREDVFKSYFNKPYKFGLASGGRVGYHQGGEISGDLAYDATNVDIYGSSAIGNNMNQGRPLGGEGIMTNIPQTLINPIRPGAIRPFESGEMIQIAGQSPQELTGDDLVKNIKMRMTQRDVKPDYWNAYANDVLRTGGNPTKSMQEYQTQFGYQPPQQLPLSSYSDNIKSGLSPLASMMYAEGGRVGYAYGSGVKLIQLLQKAGKSLKDEIKKAVDDLIPSGDPKLDADMAVDNMLEDLNINRDTLDEYDILDAYGMAYDELKKPLLANIKNKPDSLSPKLIERFELKQKYPGIDEELVTKIVDDPDPQRKAEVLATIEQAFELMKQGKSSDEVLDIMKQMTDRTKQAGGGLSYLSGF